MLSPRQPGALWTLQRAEGIRRLGAGRQAARAGDMTDDDKDLAAARRYGVGDASYQAAGGSEGISQLVHRFYEHMDALAEVRTIRAMHDPDLGLVREKLAVFLCAW